MKTMNAAIASTVSTPTTVNAALAMARALAVHHVTAEFDGSNWVWPAKCAVCGPVATIAHEGAARHTERLASTAAAHHAGVLAPMLAASHAAILAEAAEAMAGDRPGSFWDRRRAELAGPYSKPMLTEQGAELDGIEAAATWLRQFASDLHA